MLKLYKKYLKYYKKEVLLGPLFKLLEAVFELFVPLVIAAMINHGFMNHDFNYVLKMFALLIALAITGLSSTLVCQYFASRASQGFGTLLRADVYNKAIHLNKTNFDYFGVPRLVSIINTDIKNVEYSVAMLIRLVIRAPFIVLGAIIMSFVLNINFGIITLVSSVILLSTILYLMLKTIPHNKEALKSLDNISELFKEDIGASYLIRANSSYNYEENKMNTRLDDLYKKNKLIALMQAMMTPSTLLIVNTAIVVGILISYNFINISILPGDIVAFISYLNQILIASTVVCNLIITFGKAISSSDRINYLLDYENIINFNNIDNYNDDKEILSISNLNYKFYHDSDLVIDNISLKINKGDFITIVGPTGSGKTTLLNLISNILDKTSGYIYFDNKEITNYSKEEFYNNISYVLQNNTIINASIYDNITFGKDELDEQALYNSLAINVINKKESKLDEEINDFGTNLSGGEKKRILLARALNKKPKLLILDQTLAGLDNMTLNTIVNNLKNLNITTLLVTDNKNVIKLSDKIILLDNGKLEGYDTYNNLINNNKLFIDLIGENYEE